MQNNNKLDKWPTTLFFFLTKMYGQAAVKRDSILYDVAFEWNKKKYHWNGLIAKNGEKWQKEGKYVDNFNQK